MCVVRQKQPQQLDEGWGEQQEDGRHLVCWILPTQTQKPTAQ